MQAISPGPNWLLQVIILRKQTFCLAQFTDSEYDLYFHKVLKSRLWVRVSLFRVLANSRWHLPCSAYSFKY